METSFLYDLIYMVKLKDYRDKLEKDENDGFFKDERKAREELEKTLSTEQLKLLKDYIFHFDLRLDYLNYQTDIKLLNYGVKIGMELQKAFDDEEP